MSPVEALLLQLREDAPLNPGATAEELNRLQSYFGGELPDDVRLFYSLANGMPDFEMDRHTMCFWSVERMQLEMPDWGDSEIGFSDYCMRCWRFVLRRSTAGLVVFSGNVKPGEPYREIGTFSEFADIYVRDPSKLGLYIPERQNVWLNTLRQCRNFLRGS